MKRKRILMTHRLPETRVSAELYGLVDQAAQTLGRSKAAVIREALMEYLGYNPHLAMMRGDVAGSVD